MKLAYDTLAEGGLVVRCCPARLSDRAKLPTRFPSLYFSVRPESQDRASIVADLKAAGFVRIRSQRVSRESTTILGRK